MLESLLIQNVLVAAIVSIAAVLLLIRASKYFLPRKTSSGCSTGCTSCPSNSATNPKLLQLGEGSPQR